MTIDPVPRGLDPRRLFSPADRRRIWLNQRKYCAICASPVRLKDSSFHVHHIIPHHLGGSTVIRNAVGLCQRCHRELDHTSLTGPPPAVLRDWQEANVNNAVEALSRDGGIFTVAAAPGSGKSMFAGVVAARLWDAGHIGRVVVVTPTGQLVDQWADNLAYDVAIWIDGAVKTVPSNMRHGYCGVGVTYASFAKASAVRDHLAIANETPTLFVFDEVHHAADQLPWGTAAKALVRQVPAARFMNLSGTLFRSKPGELIATVRYDRDDDGMMTAKADVTIWADELIGTGDLRDLELFEFDSEVRAVDVATGEIATSSQLGIAGDATEIHSALIADDEWLRGFFARWLAHLQTQRQAYDYNFKGLVVAASQDLAERYRILLEDLLQGTGQPVWVAKSEDGDIIAKEALEDARTATKPGVLVAVAMASEGYDNPDLSSIAYLSNIAAELRLAQIGGRVMRPTKHERKLGRNLPGTVWLPAIPKLTAKWRDVLLAELHTITVDELTCARCGLSKPCECDRAHTPRVCPSCGLPKPCECELGKPQDPTKVYSFTDSELTGLYHNGEEVAVGAYELVHNTLVADGQDELVPFAAAITNAMRHVDAVTFFNFINKD